MLSKSEVQYLQGQKQVSQSYERKLKCLIRKKIAVLQKELPLLSNLFGYGVNSFMDISTATKLAVPSAKDKRSFKQLNQPLTPNTCATKVSNLDSNDIEIDADKDEKSRNSDEFPLLVKDNSTPATESSNVQIEGATKNSNSRNPVNITKWLPNLSETISTVIAKISIVLIKMI